MNHDIIKRVIMDMHDVINDSIISERQYFFEPHANYILVGVRRAGKSTLLYKRVLELIRDGCSWEQIIYINFEDDRLTGFRTQDFDDIIESAHEMTDQKPYYFFDEIQNIDGWERFARRMADHHEHVLITGSNARMLSSEMEAVLGGRYLSMMIMPFSFTEVLDYKGIRHDPNSLYSTDNIGRIRGAAEDYLKSGGLPESLDFKSKRAYIQNVYDKVLLGDIIARNKVMNTGALRLLIKKIAETVMQEVSYTKLAGSVRAVGLKCSTDAAITYTGYAEEAYLLFHTSNYVTKFSERESTPRFYFMDNGFLSLFLIDKNSALLENAVAIHLHRRWKDVYYYKSSVTGIDIDFYVPEKKTAVQVAYALSDTSENREVTNLIRFAKKFNEADRYIIVTFEEERTMEQDNIKMEVVPLHRFLMQNEV